MLFVFNIKVFFVKIFKYQNDVVCPKKDNDIDSRVDFDSRDDIDSRNVKYKRKNRKLLDKYELTKKISLYRHFKPIIVVQTISILDSCI